MQDRNGLQKVDNRRVKNNRMMWAMAHELGYDSETLHTIVESITSKKHISELSQSELFKVNTKLIKGIKEKTKGYYKMRKKVFALCYDLDWARNEKVDSRRLNGYIKRVCKKKNIYFLNGKDLQNLIVALERLIKWDKKHDEH